MQATTQVLSPNSDALSAPNNALPSKFVAIGRAVAIAGVVLPLFTIGLIKFKQFEVEALKPLISGTPWLTPLYSLFGFEGASYFLGVVEIATAFLFLASIWSARAGVVAGAVGVLTFVTTVSIMFAIPIWEAPAGGFPWINGAGAFLIKDVALLGVSLVVLGESLSRLRGASGR